MDNHETKITAGGLYVRGVVVSSHAHAFQRKDGSGIVVKLQHEIATQPGVVLFEQYFDPKETPTIKIEGDKVVSFPELKQFTTLTLKVQRYRFDRERFIVTAADTINGDQSATG